MCSKIKIASIISNKKTISFKINFEKKNVFQRNIYAYK